MYALLKRAAALEVKSSLSHRREYDANWHTPKAPPLQDVSVHQAPSISSRRYRVSTNFDARLVLDARRRAEEDRACHVAPPRGEPPAHEYSPRRSGCYNNAEDRNPSLDPPGPRVFSRCICNVPFPMR